MQYIVSEKKNRISINYNIQIKKLFYLYNILYSVKKKQSCLHIKYSISVRVRLDLSLTD